MENNVTMGTILYQMSLPMLLFSYIELYFFTTVVSKDIKKDINRILKEVNTHLTNEYTDQLQAGHITNEQFLRKTYETMVILSKMQKNHQEDIDSTNAYLKKLSYFVLFMFGLFVVFSASRVKNEFDVFDMSNVMSGHVMINTILLLMIGSIFQYNFYTHFFKGYKFVTSEQIVTQIIQKIKMMFEKPDELNCDR
tara:strand:- start:3657 stop:4241 length:585 start_codon:yes stop_codon:yes gene_type:complete